MPTRPRDQSPRANSAFVPSAPRAHPRRAAWRSCAAQLLNATGVLIVLVSATPAFAPPAPLEGFGTTTPGGAGQPIVRVNNLEDSGPGSLRDALSGGYRTIVFDVAGTIKLESNLVIRGPFVTIDGSSAPSPGITLKNRGLVIRETNGAHDVIVQGLRIRDAKADGIQIKNGAYNVAIHRCSIRGSGDGNIDITEDVHDVTVSWSILAEPRSSEKNMLIKYNPARITLHHNLFVKAAQRNPQVRIDNDGSPAADTTADIRNNLVWEWESYGTLIWFGPRANVVANYYASSRNPDDALLVRVGARAYVADNASQDGIDVNAPNTEAAPFPAPTVATTDACTAAHAVLAGAGAPPLDAVDRAYLDAIDVDC